jgi:hypothetical protein
VSPGAFSVALRDEYYDLIVVAGDTLKDAIEHIERCANETQTPVLIVLDRARHGEELPAHLVGRCAVRLRGELDADAIRTLLLQPRAQIRETAHHWATIDCDQKLDAELRAELMDAIRVKLSEPNISPNWIRSLTVLVGSAKTTAPSPDGKFVIEDDGMPAFFEFR